MRLRVIALDYDGTLAEDGVIHPDVPGALHEARAHGLYVVLVTGRRVDDLRRVLGDLRLFDAIVAENGAVVLFPAAGPTRRLAPRIPPRFVEALREAGVTDAVPGECLVEMDAGGAHAALDVIRRSELALALHFNRGRLMVLPVAVSKATGLREALRYVRLSVHNAIGVGDAENDQELLSVCEVGAAVAWGSEVLKAGADRVLAGHGPGAMAEHLRAWVRWERIEQPPQPRRAQLVGRDSAGESVFLALGSRNLLIVGEPGSGKSWIAGLTCEHLVLQGYSVCVLDPTGEHGALDALPGVVVLDGEHPPAHEAIASLLRHADTSVVVRLARSSPDERARYVAGVLPMLAELRRRTGLPHRIVVDDAHPLLRREEAVVAVDEDLAGYTFVCHQASGLHPDLRLGAGCVIATRIRRPEEVRLLHRSAGADEPVEHWERLLAGLELGEVAFLPPTAESEGRALRVRLAPRLTHPERRTRVREEVRVEDGVAFQFVGEDGAAGPRVRSVGELVAALTRTRADGLAGHLRRGDLSRWIESAWGDRALAEHVREVERRFWHGLVGDPVGALVHALRGRGRGT